MIPCAIAAPTVSIATSTGEGVRDGTKFWWNSSLAAIRNAITIAIVAHRADHPRSSARTARNASAPRMAYSIRWASFRITKCSGSNFSGGSGWSMIAAMIVSRRDKALVELVARRNQERDHDRDRCPSSRPSALLRAHGAKCQRPEHGVFRQVGELPDHEVQQVELFQRKRMADDRGDDRLDHRSRMLRRESVRRSHEDHGRPRAQGKPVAEERARHDSVAKRAFVGFCWSVFSIALANCIRCIY